MKPIKRSENKISLPVKLMVLLVFLVGAAAFILSMKFSGAEKRTFPALEHDPDIAAPLCNVPGGFYTAPFSIALQAAPGTKIYYTTDGTEPGLGATVYNGPVLIHEKKAGVLSQIPTSPRWKPPVGEVFNGTVIRAIAVNEMNRKSAELLRTYWLDEKGRARYTLPVVALTMNPGDLFDYKNGIYVLGKNYEDKERYIRKKIPLDLSWWQYPSNYQKRGKNAEREGWLELHETGDKPAFGIKAGIRIHGNATRGFPQKALRISMEDAALAYELFPGSGKRSYRSLILRNAGNDWNKTMFRDAFMQSLMEGTGLDLQSYKPVILFINGEYWGIHELRERQDEDYIALKYGLDKNSIVILENEGDAVWGAKKDEKEFRRFISEIKNTDLADEAAYGEVQKKIDIDNLIDLVIANVYFCNSDWPNNNLKFWKYRSDQPASQEGTKADGRWRWMLFDTDWGFGYTGAEAYRISLLEKAKNTGSFGVIFSGLLENEQFRKKFRQRFEYHLGSTFSNERVLGRIEEFRNRLAPEMPEHINRWRGINSFSSWESYVEELREFQLKRHAIQTEQLNNFLAK